MLNEPARRCYQAFGLVFSSPFPLPGGCVCGVEPDIVVEQGHVDVGHMERRGTPWELWFRDRSATLLSDGLGAFEVIDGQQIRLDPESGVDTQIVFDCITGAVVAVALYQRGFLPIHASSVSVDGAGVCFIGDSGSGKSTMAAAMMARSHALISDDVTALSMVDGVPLMLPGFRQIKLSSSAIEVVGGSLAGLALSRQANEKGVYHFQGPMMHDSVPMRRIYVLARGSDLRIMPLGTRDALLSLLSNTYVSFLKPRDGGDFRRCEQLVNQVDVRLLMRPRSIDLLPRVAELVEADLAGA